MKFNIVTFGCKVNYYESESMNQMMLESGYELSESFTDSDIVIINSCTVTAESDRKIRQLINKVKRNNKNCIVVLAGCIPQAFPQRFDYFNDVDIVIGNSNKNKISKMISNFIKNKNKLIDIKNYDNNSKFENLSVNKFQGHTRAFMKIEDGCNRFCSYCIIPYSRGRVRSRKIEDIIDEAKKLSNNGYKEIVLVGINLSCYGSDIGKNLCDAVEAVCNIDGIERVRLGSLEPELINLDVIRRLSNQKKFCPQFHLSLQSGCNKTLKDMNRHYSSEEYFKITEMIRKSFKDAMITTDVMVGFPGETEEDFNESVDFVSKVRFLKVHVFPYSVRPGTRAAKFNNQVDNSVKKQRAKKMIEITNEISKKIISENINRIYQVLYERCIGNNVYEGYTNNYILIKTYSEENIKGKILDTRILSQENEYCKGEIV